MDTTTTTTSTKSPDSENDTPPHIQPIKSLSFTNGVLKKHNTHLRHQEPLSAAAVVYKECLKNHAASIGGHAVDGCGEFMASSTARPSDPTSLKCAACGCHRNFHRREYDEYCSPNFAATAATASTYFIDFSRNPRQPPPPPSGRFSTSPSPPSQPPNMLLSLSTAVHEDTPPTNHHHHNNHYHQVATPITPTSLKGENQSGRKRFRTKFTTEQKEKMRLFAEKLGWKLQKSDEAMIEEFCDEIGIARGVLKVWMHNNKHTFSTKKDISNSNGGNIENDGVISFENNKINNNGGVFHQNENNNNNGSDHDDDLHVSNNGSFSSS